MQNLYEQLKPKFRKELDESAGKYESVNRIKYLLMANVNWSELNIQTVKDLILFTSIDTRDIGINAMLYGNTILDES